MEKNRRIFNENTVSDKVWNTLTFLMLRWASKTKEFKVSPGCYHGSFLPSVRIASGRRKFCVDWSPKGRFHLNEDGHLGKFRPLGDQDILRVTERWLCWSFWNHVVWFVFSCRLRHYLKIERSCSASVK